MFPGNPNPNDVQIPGWLAGLIAGGAGIAGGIPTPASQISNGTSNTDSFSSGNTDTSSAQFLQNLIQSILNTSSSGEQSQTTTPNLSPETQALISNLTQRFSSQNTPISAGNLAGLQTQQINSAYNSAGTRLDEVMASRGLSTSPVSGTAQANLQTNRVGDVNRAVMQSPMQAQSMNLANLSATVPFLQSIPHGTTTTGGQTQNTSQFGSQNQNQQQTGSQQTSANNVQQQNTVNQSNQQNKTGGGIGGALGSGIGALIGLLPFLSDKRVKHDIEKIDAKLALDKIVKLHPKTWKWNGIDAVTGAGVVAQELQETLPNLVHDNEGILTVNYPGLIPYLIGAVQDLNERVEAK